MGLQLSEENKSARAEDAENHRNQFELSHLSSSNGTDRFEGDESTTEGEEPGIFQTMVSFLQQMITTKITNRRKTLRKESLRGNS